MTLRALLVILAALVFAVLAMTVPGVPGRDPAAVAGLVAPAATAAPALSAVLLTPPAFLTWPAFLIWELVLGWLVVHALFGFFLRAKSLDWDETRQPLLWFFGIGVLWLLISPLWTLLAPVFLIAMLAMALAAFLSADEDYDRWLLCAPLAALAGWLSVLAPVSVGAAVAGHGLFSAGDTALVVAGLILPLATLVQWRHPTMPVYSAAAVWALVWIAIANLTAHPVIAICIAGVAAAIGALALWLWRRARSAV